MWSKNGGQNRKPSTWWVDQKGYVVGRIWIGGSQKHVKKHRLIVEAALGRMLLPDEDVHHINGDKTDNRLENLQVVSHSEHSRITNRVRHSARAEGRA